LFTHYLEGVGLFFFDYIEDNILAMEKQKIEKHDRELLGKVRKIIEKKMVLKKTGLPKAIVFASVFIFLIIVSFFSIIKETNQKQSAATDEQIIYQNESEKQNINLAQSVKEVESSTRNIDSEIKADIVETLPLREPDNISQDSSGAKNVLSNSFRRDGFKEAKTSGKTESSLFRISGISVCSGIENKNPKGKKKIFYLKKDKYIFIWMEVRPEFFPTTLSHIYYLNGAKYVTVPLGIKYKRMRTWSRITLNSYAKAGLWRVDVVTQDNRILKSVDFEVKNNQE